MVDLVECYSSSKYAERPTAFYWQEERLEISQVIKHWRTPIGVVFWVETTDDQQFELSYNESSDEWRIKHIYEANKERR
jgi:hypothetical protein